MDYYLSNLEILERCNLQLADLVKKTRENNLELITTKRGPKSIRVKGKILHSLYDPLHEAEQLALRTNLDNDLVIVFGFGLGYHVFEILKRVKKETLIIVFEESVAIFKKALGELDLVELLNSPQVRLVVGKDQVRIREDLQNWIRPEEVKGLSLVEHPPSTALAPMYYVQVRKILYDVIHQKFQGMRTRFTFQTLWMRNSILNLPQMLTIPGVKYLFNGFQDIPAFLIGAGPSLQKNIRELNLAKGRSLLIATDTALKPLLSCRIIPDIILSCDAQDKSMGDFEGIGEIPSVLVAATLAYPEILKAYQGPKILFTIAQLQYTEDGREIAKLASLARWIEEITEPKGYLQAGGSVSTLAFDLARNLGCDPIVFIGHDLAFSGDRLYTPGVDYIKDYRYMKEYMKPYMDSLGEREGTPSFEAAYNRAVREGVVDCEFIKRRKLFHVPSIDLKGEVLTSDAFYTYLRWFEDAISRIPNRTFINATEGGANIAGTKVMRLVEVIRRYCQDGAEIKLLNKVASMRPSVDIKGAIEILKGVIANLEELSMVSHELIHSPFDEGLKRIDELINELRFVDIFSRGKDLEFQWLEEVSRELKALFEGSLKNIETEEIKDH